jgi:hypothetical protein
MAKEHDPRSPIWESEVIAVEAFYSEDHTYIQRDLKTTSRWRCNAEFKIPGSTETDSYYTTNEIQRMIDNHSTSKQAVSLSCRGRRHVEEKISKANVISVLLWYDGKYEYFNRDNANRSLWRNNDDKIIYTTDVKAILHST